MKALVVYATKYGATADIADRLAATMTEGGVEATAVRAEDAGDLSDDDAVVLGSAVYLGSWLKPAKAFAVRHRDALASRPVWLFSSGPLPGAVVPEKVEEGSPGAAPKEAEALATELGAREHVVFDGALDPARLKGRDRLIRTLPAGKALLPEVDGRDWDAIDAWAQGIATALTDRPSG